MMRSNYRLRRGSVQVELLIITGVIVVIAAIVLGVYIGLGTNQRHLATLDQLALIQEKLRMFHDDMGRWPLQEEGLEVLWNDKAIALESERHNWIGPYLQKQSLIDIWGNAWIYNNPDSVNKKYMLLSIGYDHTYNTPDDLGISISQLDDADR